MHGTVYILENLEAGLVKVGMTINQAAERLRDANDLWLGRKGSCQICGVRLVVRRDRMPEHRRNGTRCRGSRELPLEKDSAVAEWFLRSMQDDIHSVTGARLSAHRIRRKRLERLIAMPRHADIAVGSWRLHSEVFTDAAEAVELRAHTYLVHALEESAPMGEVFRCSPEEALLAVERALAELGHLQSARRKSHV
jgi:hypothetical protein